MVSRPSHTLACPSLIGSRTSHKMRKKLTARVIQGTHSRSKSLMHYDRSIGLENPPSKPHLHICTGFRLVHILEKVQETCEGPYEIAPKLLQGLRDDDKRLQTLENPALWASPRGSWGCPVFGYANVHYLRPGPIADQVEWNR